ncbi:P-loop containing nucleoside triphosphate hydrolase protein [Cladorrhinum samala]|uniref:P-loop containing nucleoside triphosphate hydrolase protein n=1 Tax=Cladorrhinum samala TaxID=585594 RepID=A0AAV9HJG6_9PEZI|nr:P-loop containing nucleoside triphosphate hydrolase protein [Cladorrhinum samala]
MLPKSKWSRGGSKPLMKFPNLEEFITRHRDATIAEFEGEAQRIQEFNDKELRFKAAVITAPSASQPYQSHVLRVDLSAERCSVVQKMEIDTVALNSSWARYTELVVHVPPADAEKLGGYLNPNLGRSSTNPDSLRSDKGASWIYIQLRLQASRVNIDAELRPVRWLVDGVAGQEGNDVLSYLMKFEEPKRTVDLRKSYPQLADLNLIMHTSIRVAMREIIQGFDQDQSKAYKSLNSIPEGVCFIPGGPGAGKTRWALSTALVAQAGVKPCKVLYLVDINSAVDDAADRMQALYNKTGLKNKAIRMLSWPGVDKTLFEENNQKGGIPRATMAADFTEGFLRAESCPRVGMRAPTLHQAACEVFNSPGYQFTYAVQYNRILGELWKIKTSSGHKKNLKADLESLRKTLVPLYFHTICNADFIATTPVVARWVRMIFHPDIVIFNECGHARELTTIMSLAFFRPKAYFFVGDHRQTEPYAEDTGHKYAPQLKMSTLERADANGAAPNQLLVNHRATGCGPYLGNTKSTKCLDGLGWCLGSSSIIGATRASKRRKRPSWSPVHHEVVMGHVKELLRDQKFTQVDGETPGTVMILTPYRAATAKYLEHVTKLNKRMKDRVMVRTIDAAQGQEADVVFFDLVKDHGTTHTDNPKRLCVSLTRARQAELIMLSAGMASSGVNNHTRKIWKLCESGEAGAILHIRPPKANNCMSAAADSTE